MKQQEIKTKCRSYPMISVQTLVVGSGAAGLNAAVSLVKEGVQDVAILTEGRTMGTSRNTGSDKQTYYKLTTCGSEPDSIRKMAQTLFAGQAVDGDLALAEAALSLRGFYHLVDIGVPFPCNGSGEYAGYKTDHDPNQRGTSAGPLTSKFMTDALWAEVDRYGVPVFDGYQVIEILTSNGRVYGVLALNRAEADLSKKFTVFIADNVIYATGGEAGMYDASVYPISQTGGTGTALRAGAMGKNLTESQYGIASVKFRWNLSGTYQQVIPRYVSTDPEGKDEQEFLEAYFDDPRKLLHAIFLKGYQWPFDPRKTKDYGSSLIDLLVYQETVLKGRRVFLDFTKNPRCYQESLLTREAYEYLRNSGGLQPTPIERLTHMNPAAIALYKSHNIDLSSELLEIGVCAQHNNGGLSGNHWWESNLKHFFPVGEVNGSHGVYRPGGSALNAGQVGSFRAAQYIAACYTAPPLEAEQVARLLGAQIDGAFSWGVPQKDCPILDIKAEQKALRVRMTRYGANIRSLDGVCKALEENRIQQQKLENTGTRNSRELALRYRLRDLLVSQQVYLTAMADYIRRGGTSRGSYLIYDPEGQKPLEPLPESFRFSTEETGLGTLIQEITYHDGKCTCTWRPVRPIPEEDSWFEQVWKKHREKKYFFECHAIDCTKEECES